MLKKVFQKLKSRFKRDSEKSARESMLEELFYDLNRSRVSVYKVNFVRGLFFGLGSAIGASVLIALLIGILNMFSDLPGGIGSFIERILDAMNKTTSA